MTYDKNSFLAGIAVGRQLRGWSVADGYVTPGRYYLYRNGAVYADLGIPNNPNPNAWSTQGTPVYQSDGILLQQIDPPSHTPHGVQSIVLTGVALNNAMSGMGRYNKLIAKFTLLDSAVGGINGGTNAPGIILEVSSRKGFVNTHPVSERHAGMYMTASEGDYTLEVDMLQLPFTPAYCTFMVYTDYNDGYSYTHLGSVKLKELFLTI